MNYNVVFHVDETGKWELTLKNVSNLLQQIDARTAHVEVVANAEAVTGYVLPQSPFAAALHRLNAQGVTFVACNNALKALGIAPGSLMPFTKVVPAGVLELIERQAKGYAYIKP